MHKTGRGHSIPNYKIELTLLFFFLSIGKPNQTYFSELKRFRSNTHINTKYDRKQKISQKGNNKCKEYI